MILGDTAFQAGQIFGLLILVLVGVGVLRTVSRADLTWREKVLGNKSNDRG